MRSWKIALVMVALLVCCHESTGAMKRESSPPSYVSGTAVSLRELQRNLENQPRGVPPNREIAELGGITRLIGYMIDAAGKDIILFGENDASAVPIFLDDLVVALRNAFLKYAPIENNTYLYSYPGCSIDPNPKVIRSLDSLGDVIASAATEEATEAVIRDWHRLCRSPQTVRVMGVPFDSRFAKVMVTADYDMKRFVDGTDSLKTKRPKSLTETTLAEMRTAVLHGTNPRVPPSSMDRFWFYPGRVAYRTSSRLVVVDQCPIRLLTEAEHLAASGQIRGRGRSNPLAQAFADTFTAIYGQAAAERPIYRDLENIFQLVAIAKMLEYRNAVDTAGLDLSYLLERYRVADVPVQRTLLGRSDVKEFSHEEKTKNGSTEYHVWLPSCGGVSIEIRPPKVEITPDEENLSALGQEMIARPQNAVTWKVHLIRKGELEDPEGWQRDRAYALIKN